MQSCFHHILRRAGEGTRASNSTSPGLDNALDKENNKSEADERSWYMCVQHREDVSPNNKARFAVRCIGDDTKRTLREFRDSCGIDTIEYADSEEDDDNNSEADDDDNVEEEAEGG